MELVEEQSAQLAGILPKTYTSFNSDLLRELLRIFNNKTLDEVGGDVIGRIYEYFSVNLPRLSLRMTGCSSPPSHWSR